MVVPVLFVKSKSSRLSAIAVAGLNALATATKPQPIIEPWMIMPITDFLNTSYAFIFCYKFFNCLRLRYRPLSVKRSSNHKLQRNSVCGAGRSAPHEAPTAVQNKRWSDGLVLDWSRYAGRIDWHLGEQALVLPI
jgi:hypothetical protein